VIYSVGAPHRSIETSCSRQEFRRRFCFFETLLERHACVCVGEGGRSPSLASAV
jgi:hypothetical protein